MFGGLGRINAERQRNVLALLNDGRLTPEQKSAFCYDEGICDGCGVKTVWVGPFKRRPYTNERVWNGICRSCYPEKCAAADANSSSAATAPWGKMQNLVVPPEVLMAKTSDAFNSLQSSVSEGINNLNETVNSDKAKAFRTEMRHGSVKAFDSVSSSVAGGINVLNESIKKNTENMDMSGTTKALKEGSTRAINNLQTGVNNIKSKTIPKKKDPNQQQQQKADLANLKMKFKTNNEELSKKGTAPDELSLKENNEVKAPKSKVDPPEALIGKLVKTPYGLGVVNDYRTSDEMFVIALHPNSSSASVQQEQKPSNATTKLFCKRETFDVVFEDEKSNSSKTRQKQSMELNEAYESLEKMRRLNLEVQCQERGIVGPIDFNKCTHCLLNPDQDKNNQEQQQQQPQSFRRIRNLIDNNKNKKVSACLFCGNPTCEARHACPAFRKEGITACQDCVKLFESDYIVACINQAHGLSVEMASIAENQGVGVTETRPLDHMMDLYDRVLLLLQYSSQYIEAIATELEKNTKRGNNVNMGASSVGIVSGALGVAAAAAIFTPAGPPLLVASLMLGGGATAAQTGTEVVNYFSEPNKFADKIIALIGMVHSLLRVKESLREILTARLLQEQGNPDVDKLKLNLEKLRKKQVAAAVKAGTTVASTAVLGGVAGAAAVESAAIVSSVEVGALAGRQANMLTKSGTAVARGARFARFAGGALSAATILLEAKTMHSTIEQINLGHPCEKANALRAILKEIPTLPTTEQLDEECRIYVGAMSNRVNATSLEDAINLIESKAIQEWQVTKAQLQGSDSELAPEGASIVDGEDQSEWESVTGALSASLMGNSVQSMPPTDADSVATPPVPKVIDATPIPLSESQSSSAPTTNHVVRPARLTQSMSALPPSEPITPSTQSQSALLDRIKKFKQEESFGSTGSNNAAAAS